MTHGNFYQTVDRRVHKQPDAKKDVMYGEGNYIDRICGADARRTQRQTNVAPLTSAEKEALETKRNNRRMPQKAPLDECDLLTIKNYIADAQEEEKRHQDQLAAQKAYCAELDRFAAAKKAVDPDDLTEEERAMMAAPRMVRAPF